MSRYHIAYSDRIVLKDGTVIHSEDVQLYEPTHEYDVGTREAYGKSRNHDKDRRFVEDFMIDYGFVSILETGRGVYKFEHLKETEEDADNKE